MGHEAEWEERTEEGLKKRSVKISRARAISSQKSSGEGAKDLE